MATKSSCRHNATNKVALSLSFCFSCAPSSIFILPTNFSLESIAVDDFISQLKKLLPETFLVSLHPIVNDVVLIQSTLKRKEHLPSANKLVVVGSLCAAAVLRGADVYAPGVQATPAYLQV